MKNKPLSSDNSQKFPKAFQFVSNSVFPNTLQFSYFVFFSLVVILYSQTLFNFLTLLNITLMGGGDAGSNSGPCTCWASPLPLTYIPHQQFSLMYFSKPPYPVYLGHTAVSSPKTPKNLAAHPTFLFWFGVILHGCGLSLNFPLSLQPQ